MPLERNSLGEELSCVCGQQGQERAISNKTIPNAQSGSEEGSGQANIDVLEGGPESSKGSDSPHDHFADEAAGEGVAVGHDGTVQGIQEGEGQRHDRDSEVDQPRSIGVAEVDGSRIKGVVDERHFGENGRSTDPMHHPNELEDAVPGVSQQQDGMVWEGRKVRRNGYYAEYPSVAP